jgi:DNA-binding phage protein
MNSKLTRSHEEATIERFQKDPDLAAEYLDAILKDGDEGELLQALQRIRTQWRSMRGWMGNGGTQNHCNLGVLRYPW